MEGIPSFFQDSIITMKEASYDSDKKEYMTTSEIKVINFDLIKDKYIKTIHPNENWTILSNDALFFCGSKIVFIEFKNGAINPVENNRIIFKLYDSILLLFDSLIPLDWYQDKIERNISFAREHIEYVLVYNEERQSYETPQTLAGLERQRRYLQESKNRDEIAKYIREKANKTLIKFGLDRFKNYIFKEVYTLTREEFNEKFIPHIQREGLFEI
jgi:hypothetical protein